MALLLGPDPIAHHLDESLFNLPPRCRGLLRRGLYDKLKWCADPELPTKHRHLVKFCRAVDNTFYLYEIF